MLRVKHSREGNRLVRIKIWRRKRLYLTDRGIGPLILLKGWGLTDSQWIRPIVTLKICSSRIKKLLMLSMNKISKLYRNSRRDYAECSSITAFMGSHSTQINLKVQNFWSCLEIAACSSREFSKYKGTLQSGHLVQSRTSTRPIEKLHKLVDLRNN
jgi:hypothetical protein